MFGVCAPGFATARDRRYAVRHRCILTKNSLFSKWRVKVTLGDGES